MKEYQSEYESWLGDIVNKFSELCSVKMDYQDYCNYIREKDMDTRFSFYHPHERVLIDMMLDKSFEKDGVKTKILERQEQAKQWLAKNILTYDEWVLKFK